MSKELKDIVLSLVIADDDTDDQYLLQKAIWKVNSNYKITSVYNGQQLMDLLQQKGAYKRSDESIPDCIFLDLKMPLLDGFDVLEKMKKNTTLSVIPVYVLSSHDSTEQRKQLASLGVIGFFEKTPNFDQWRKTIEHVLLGISRKYVSKT